MKEIFLVSWRLPSENHVHGSFREYEKFFEEANKAEFFRDSLLAAIKTLGCDEQYIQARIKVINVV